MSFYQDTCVVLERATVHSNIWSITDLSKAFDCLSHEFRLTKVHAYGFNITMLRLVYSHLKNRKQRTSEIGSVYNVWEEILFGVPQRSTLGSLPFNTLLCDSFYVMSDTDFASYADDNTTDVSADTIDEVIKTLETASVKLFKWFADNQRKANQDKCNLIFSKNENVSVHIGPFEIKAINCEKLSVTKVCSRLSFNELVDSIVKKASRKINALSRITPFINIRKIMHSYELIPQLTI